MSIHDAMTEACRRVGIHAPVRSLSPGKSVRTQVDGKARSNKSGSVKLNEDGRSGVATNFVTGEAVRFLDSGFDQTSHVRPQRDLKAERRAEMERQEVARICTAILQACRMEPHPYLAAKGFPDEVGLVVDDLRPLIPTHDLGQRIAFGLPEGAGPWLIIPGRIRGDVSTIQIIGPDGAKKNIYRGKMQGAAHRIATGRETWVCEGIATALTVRAALRLLNRSATVLSAFSASNVSKVASSIPDAIIAADHDKPLEQLHGKGTGEFYASQTGLVWTMPPQLGDFNDMHASEGLRAVALHLREVRPP